MTPTILAALLELSGIAFSMAGAGLAMLGIGLLAAKNDIAEARGLNKVVALSNVCFAIPLAIFGALHLFGPQLVMPLVPAYMPWRMFWVYVVGCGLIAASLSIATRIGVRWSGLLFGIMMFGFVAMIHLPGALRAPHDRFVWTIVLRETAFGGAGWVLAGSAMSAIGDGRGRIFIAVGRVSIALAAIFFGVQHFLHPLGLPGVPLQREMPAWIFGRALIDYLTGAFLIVGGVCFLFARNTRTAAKYLGAWIVLLVVAVYGPVLIGSLADPSSGMKIEGLNYFADTLLFGGAILSLAAPARLRQAR